MQGLLELADLPYVGSGVVGSAVGHGQGRDEADVRGVRAPAPRLPRATATATTARAFADRVEAELGIPCFVKPANMGSSVGVAKAHDAGRARRRDRGRRSRSTSGSSPRRRSSAARSRSAVLGDDPPRGVGARRDRARARSSTTTPTSTRTAPRSSSIPAPSTRRTHRRGARPGRAGLRGVPPRGDGARRLLLRRDARLPRQRGEHDPRVHADLDVPAALGGVGRAVPRSCSTASSTSPSPVTPAATARAGRQRDER